MPDKYAPWPGDNGVLGPESEGWPAPLDPWSFFAGVSGGEETIRALMSKPAYDWSPVEDAADMGTAHTQRSDDWYGTWMGSSSYGGPSGPNLKRIRDVFGEDLSPVRAMRIWRMRVALSHAQSNADLAEKSIADLIDRLRKASTLGAIADILSDVDYEW